MADGFNLLLGGDWAGWGSQPGRLKYSMYASPSSAWHCIGMTMDGRHFWGLGVVDLS